MSNGARVAVVSQRQFEKLVKRFDEFKKRFDRFEIDRSFEAVVRAIDKVEVAIRESKGEMTAEQEQVFIADTAAGVAKNTREIEDAQKDATTKK